MILDYIPDKEFVKKTRDSMKYNQSHISKYIVYNGFGYIFKRFSKDVKVMVITLDHPYEELAELLSGL